MLPILASVPDWRVVLAILRAFPEHEVEDSQVLEQWIARSLQSSSPHLLLGPWLTAVTPLPRPRRLLFGRFSEEVPAMAFLLPRVLDKESLDWLPKELSTRLNAVPAGHVDESDHRLVGFDVV